MTGTFNSLHRVNIKFQKVYLITSRIYHLAKKKKDCKNNKKYRDLNEVTNSEQ